MQCCALGRVEGRSHRCFHRNPRRRVRIQSKLPVVVEPAKKLYGRLFTLQIAGGGEEDWRGDVAAGRLRCFGFGGSCGTPVWWLRSARVDA